MSTVVLASTSPYRLALLRNAGIHAEGAAPQCDERSVTDADPVRRALLRAELKARSIERPDAFVIGADQVAHIDGEPFGKPRDAADHRARLRQLRGRPHTLSVGVVGVCIRAPESHGGGERSFVEHSTLRFRADLSDDELDAYVATGEGSNCAGGYAAEGLGANLIEHIEGDFTNVIGLPLYRVITLLRAIGWRPAFPAPALGPPP
jgi:septum formation protein